LAALPARAFTPGLKAGALARIPVAGIADDAVRVDGQPRFVCRPQDVVVVQVAMQHDMVGGRRTQFTHQPAGTKDEVERQRPGIPVHSPVVVERLGLGQEFGHRATRWRRHMQAPHHSDRRRRCLPIPIGHQIAGTPPRRDTFQQQRASIEIHPQHLDRSTTSERRQSRRFLGQRRTARYTQLQDSRRPVPAHDRNHVVIRQLVRRTDREIPVASHLPQDRRQLRKPPGAVATPGSHDISSQLVGNHAPAR
jgi:hypothetical protein